MEGTMTETPNTETVRSFLSTQYAGDFDTAFGKYAAPDFTWIVSTANSDELRAAIPWAGHRFEGKEGYIRLVSMLFSEFEALEFTPSHFTDAGDKVFVEGHFVFRHRETGRIAVSDFIARFDMRDGRISGGQFYENTAAVAAAREPAETLTMVAPALAATTSSGAESKAITRQLYDAFQSTQIDRWDAIISPNVVTNSPGGRGIKGINPLKRWATAFATSLLTRSTLSMNILHSIATAMCAASLPSISTGSMTGNSWGSCRPSARELQLRRCC
jgi:ketosteroid isomerase-like protein